MKMFKEKFNMMPSRTIKAIASLLLLCIVLLLSACSDGTVPSVPMDSAIPQDGDDGGVVVDVENAKNVPTGEPGELDGATNVQGTSSSEMAPLDPPISSSSQNVVSSSSVSSVQVTTAISSSSIKEQRSGTFVDRRNGQVYKTITIGNQVWMAENLKYETPYSLCYSNNGSNCSIFGYLYQTNALHNNSVCPDGWHLPSKKDFLELISNAGGEQNAGLTLRADSTWVGENGVDEYGFAALASGYSVSQANPFRGKGEETMFWSNDEKGFLHLTGEIAKYVENVDNSLDASKHSFSVRCVGGGTTLSSSSQFADNPGSSSAESPPGTFTDSRDGQVYKYVTIGSQVWMAENLNYKTSPSWCYEGSSSKCAEYGRLYTWSAAKTACPAGWHLPDTTEWRSLFDAVGGSSVAGVMLKSATGWESDCNGTDSFGFSILPAGRFYDYNGYFYDAGRRAHFWSSTEYRDFYAYHMKFEYDYASLDEAGKDVVGFSIRCLKD